MRFPLLALSFVGRMAFCVIFFLSAVSNLIPNYSGVVHQMGLKGIPYPDLSLAAAIAFLLCGSVFVTIGYQARFGALLIAVFLGLATYYFHDFWNAKDDALREAELIQFFKNLAMFGAALFLVANGSGAGSVERKAPKAETPSAF